MKRLLLAIGLFLGLATPGLAQWPYIPVINSQSTQTNAASINCVYDSPVTSGNRLYIFASWEGSTSTPTVSDTLTNTYSQAFFNTANLVKMAVYTTVTGSSGSNTITFAETSGTFMGVGCVEFPPNWSGTVDGTPTITSYSGTPATLTTGSITTAKNHSLNFAYFGNDNSAGWQQLQTASLGTWSQVVSLGGADSEALFFRVASIAGAGNTLTVDNGGTQGSHLNIAFQSNPIQITSQTQAPDGATSNAYDWFFQAAGGSGALTYSVTAGSLPTGLSLNSSTGEITGTPTVSNNYSATIQATDGTTPASKVINFKIATSMNSIAFVQAKGGSVSTGTSPLAFTSNVAANDLIVVNVGYNAAKQQITPCSDSVGTVYRLIGYAPMHPTSLAPLGGVWTYAGITPAGGANSVACPATSAGGGGGFIVSMAEFSNVQYVGNDNLGFTRGNTASPTTLTSSNLLTLVPNELLWGVCTGYTAASTGTIDAPFNGIGNVLASTAGYRIVSTVTNYTMSCDQTGNTNTAWLLSLAGFRPSAGTVVPPAGGNYPMVVKLEELEEPEGLTKLVN